MLLPEFPGPCRVVIFYPGKCGRPWAWSVTDGSQRWAPIHSADLILPLRPWASFQASAQQRLQNDQTTQDDLFSSPTLSVNLFTHIFLPFAKFQLMLSLFAVTHRKYIIHHLFDGSTYYFLIEIDSLFPHLFSVMRGRIVIWVLKKDLAPQSTT